MMTKRNIISNYYKYIFVSIILLASIFGTTYITKANTDKINMDVYLNIINSFSGTFKTTGTTYTNVSGIVFSNQNPLPVIISSDTASSYILSGDILPTNSIISGNGPSAYTNEFNIDLSNGEGYKQLFLRFFKGSEVLLYPTINLYLDNTPPTQPIIAGPTNGSTINNTVLLSWTNSVDTGVGFQKFTVILASDQSFQHSVATRTTPNNESLLDTSTIPAGKTYMIVISKDELGNTSSSAIGYFCNREICNSSTPPSGGGGGGGGGGGYIPPKVITIVEDSEGLTNQDIIYKPTPSISFIEKLIYNQEEISAYKYAYSLGITTMPSIFKASMRQKLIRKDLAKMISEYAIKVLNKKPDNTLICDFGDTSGQLLETIYYTKLACKLGLMGYLSDGVQKDDVFNPDLEVTRGQFATTFSRLIYGKTYNVPTNETIPWYQKHIQALNRDSIITKDIGPMTEEIRGRVMTMMMRADPLVSKRINTKNHASPK